MESLLKAPLFLINKRRLPKDAPVIPLPPPKCVSRGKKKWGISKIQGGEIIFPPKKNRETQIKKNLGTPNWA